MSMETEQLTKIVSYGAIIREINNHSEGRWKMERYGMDEKTPRFPRINDPKYDAGIFPGFEKE